MEPCYLNQLVDQFASENFNHMALNEVTQSDIKQYVNEEGLTFEND